jgi:hypothetical protein
MDILEQVYILGKADGWEDAPFYYNHESVQTWGLNTHILTRPLDIVFEPHDVEWWLENWDKVEAWHKVERGYPKHIEKVNEMEIPYLTLKHYDFIPTSLPYPVGDICKHFGIDYFAGGVDYMIAYAIYKRVRKIDIYGVHTTYDNEYDHQKPSLEFWIGVAIGRGIKVKVHDSHSLFKTMYRGNEHTNEGKNPDGLRYGYFVKPEVNEISVN